MKRKQFPQATTVNAAIKCYSQHWNTPQC